MRDVAKQINRSSRGRRLSVTDFSDEGPDAHVSIVDVGHDAREQQEATGAWDVESLSALRAYHEEEPRGLIAQYEYDALVEGLGE